MDLRPNRILQHSEKNYKIYLKQLLKEQHLLYKYSMRYQQAVRRKDQTVATNTLRDLTQLKERIQKMYRGNENDKHLFPSIHYTHVLNDPFIAQNQITMEDIDASSLLDNENSSQIEGLSSTMPILPASATPTTKATTDTNDEICVQQPSNERIFVERFYQQLLHELTSSSSFTKQHHQSLKGHNGNTYNENKQSDQETNSDSNKATNGSEENKNIIQSNESTNTSENQKTTSNTTTKITHATTYPVTRELLRDMTKGKQHIDQFNNYYALLGYTRHKFVERAMLVVSSLNQILQIPPLCSLAPCRSHQRIIDDITLKRWKQRILSVRTMTSIGCGPGCDAIGVVAVLLSSAAAASTSSQLQHCGSTDDITTNGNVPDSNESKDIYSPHTSVLDRIVLLDWAMEQWYHPIVQCVSNMLSSSILPHQQYVNSIICETCDVRQSVKQQRSSGANFFTTRRIKNHNVEHLQDDVVGVDDNEWLRNTDLVVISYLLSETRNAWYNFMDDYIRQYCKVGTLFLVTDPTAWQLHIFRQRYEYDNSEQYNKHDAHCDVVSDVSPHLNTFDDCMVSHAGEEEPHRPQQRRVLMEFQWLDSSMYRPELQELEGRNGPGVLLAIKVAN